MHASAAIESLIPELAALLVAEATKIGITISLDQATALITILTEVVKAKI